ncbi:MAG: transcription factor S [Candidatus Aenigmatarchaeota archaeon]|nr:transcription factor S [Candidatus Aenigmarchaeota archaeon]
MEFCKTCKNLLRVQKENENQFLFCRVCNTKTKLTEEITIETSNFVRNKEIVVINEGEQNPFPVTKIMCPKCNEIREAYWTMQQTRGGDEPPTRFYECKTCNWRWREYS